MSSPYNEPAFPIAGALADNHFNGMSLRDYFAAKAMQVLLPKLIDEWEAVNAMDGRTSEEQTRRGCLAAYKIADAMLKARKHEAPALPTERMAGAILALVLGIFGAIALMSWSVCEQDDTQCLIAGGSR